MDRYAEGIRPSLQLTESELRGVVEDLSRVVKGHPRGVSARVRKWARVELRKVSRYIPMYREGTVTDEGLRFLPLVRQAEYISYRLGVKP
jgi:hypothetical protein